MTQTPIGLSLPQPTPVSPSQPQSAPASPNISSNQPQPACANPSQPRPCPASPNKHQPFPSNTNQIQLAAASPIQNAPPSLAGFLPKCSRGSLGLLVAFLGFPVHVLASMVPLGFPWAFLGLSLVSWPSLGFHQQANQQNRRIWLQNYTFEDFLADPTAKMLVIQGPPGLPWASFGFLGFPLTFLDILGLSLGL